MSSRHIFNGFFFCSVFLEGLMLLLCLLFSSSGPSQLTSRWDKALKRYRSLSVWWWRLLELLCFLLTLSGNFLSWLNLQKWTHLNNDPSLTVNCFLQVSWCKSSRWLVITPQKHQRDAANFSRLQLVFSEQFMWFICLCWLLLCSEDFSSWLQNKTVLILFLPLESLHLWDSLLHVWATE